MNITSVSGVDGLKMALQRSLSDTLNLPGFACAAILLLFLTS